MHVIPLVRWVPLGLMSQWLVHHRGDDDDDDAEPIVVSTIDGFIQRREQIKRIIWKKAWQMQ